jgi:hypothetical protein
MLKIDVENQPRHEPDANPKSEGGEATPKPKSREDLATRKREHDFQEERDKIEAMLCSHLGATVVSSSLITDSESFLSRFVQSNTSISLRSPSCLRSLLVLKSSFEQNKYHASFVSDAYNPADMFSKYMSIQSSKFRAAGEACEAVLICQHCLCHCRMSGQNGGHFCISRTWLSESRGISSRFCRPSC